MSLIGVRSRSFRLPAKKKNALRFFNLTMDLGTQAVRQYFDSIVPPNKLAGHLAASTYETKLRNLIKKKILKKCHEEILFSTSELDKNFVFSIRLVNNNFVLNLFICIAIE